MDKLRVGEKAKMRDTYLALTTGVGKACMKAVSKVVWMVDEMVASMVGEMVAWMVGEMAVY